MNIFYGSLNRITLLGAVFMAAALWAAQGQNVPGATNGFGTVVVVTATDASASEPGTNTGSFTVRREGPTNQALLVFYELGGTAQNGVDYQAPGNNVTIPIGARTASIFVKPIDDTLAEGSETVILRLQASPLANPLSDYHIGSPSSATITIEDNDHLPQTNHPPTVQIVSPANGATYPASANVFIAAQAFDGDGFVTTVQFFAGDHSLGIATNNPLMAGAVNPFQLVWSNVPPGQYTLSAKATDDDGAMAWSPSIRITVGASNATERTFVNIFTRDETATEIPVVPPGQGRPQLIDRAVFEVVRTGATNIDLTVLYHLGGSAQNGVDYERLPGLLKIPAGALSAQIEIDPIDDFIVEGTESVELTLDTPVCIAIFPPPPECYLVGPNGKAAARIVDNDTVETNSPPVVHIISPNSGAVFIAPVNIVLGADAVDREGSVKQVEFFAGDHSLGLANGPLRTALGTWILVWSNVPPGNYAVTAKATDDTGLTGGSEPVKITVRTVEQPPPPPTNHLPSVNIVARDPIASEGTNCWGPILMVNAEDRCINPGGRNTATFVVTRSDGTNSDLTVRYSVGGTAANGIDYVRLSGQATIEAGRRSAEIVLLPIDDTLIEHAETVVLELQTAPSANNTAPAYVVGKPSRAAALIVDNDDLRPPCVLLPDNLFHVCQPGTNGQIFRVEISTNLIDWTPACTNMVTDGAVHFVDPDAPLHSLRFYRTSPEPALPPE